MERGRAHPAVASFQGLRRAADDGSGWCTLKTGAETDASFFLSSGCLVGRGVLEEWPKVPDCSSAGGDDQDEAEARSVGQ